jgi:hypothetical protein
MFFDEALEKFKLLYRDGRDEWVSGHQIKLNVALLNQKLKAAKALQLKNHPVLIKEAQQLKNLLDKRGTATTGAELQAAKALQQINIVAKEEAPIAKIVDKEEAPIVDTEEVHTQNNVTTSKNEGLNATPNVSSMVEGEGSLSNSLIADNKVKFNDGDPYRYSNVIPLLQGDVLGIDHYALLYHFMEQYFAIDKDSEVICPGDSRYAVFIRTHTFDFEAKNALTEFNALMDIVYVPEDKTDHQDDDIRVDDGDNLKLKDNKAAKTEDIAVVQTDSKAAQAEDDVNQDDEGSTSIFVTKNKQVKMSLYL